MGQGNAEALAVLSGNTARAVTDVAGEPPAWWRTGATAPRGSGPAAPPCAADPVEIQAALRRLRVSLDTLLFHWHQAMARAWPPSTAAPPAGPAAAEEPEQALCDRSGS